MLINLHLPPRHGWGVCYEDHVHEPLWLKFLSRTRPGRFFVVKDRFKALPHARFGAVLNSRIVVCASVLDTRVINQNEARPEQ